jgi:hypothetical protein
MDIRRTIAAAISVAALLFLFAPSAAFANSQTINFGANLPAGPVPGGYG